MNTLFQLGNILKYEQPSKYIVESTDYNDSYRTPVLTAGKTFILGYTNEQDGIYNNLPVIIFDDFTTASKYVNFPFKVKSSAMKILKPNLDLVDPKYIYYRMQIINIDHSTHKRYWIQQYSKIKISIPTLPEQKRIVARIEELFSNLDSAVETLQKTKQQLDVYRQAVLREVFEDIEDKISLCEIATMIDPQPSHRTPPVYNNGIPYIGIGDIDYIKKEILFSEARKVSPELLEEHLERYCIELGDFVMGKIGTIGKPFKLPLPQDYTLSANVILIKPNRDIIDSDFLFWQFSSHWITEQLLKGATATSQPAFGIKKARNLSIRICDIIQQKKVVSIINERFSTYDNVEKNVDEVLQQAEAMRQSILKQAFEGG